MNDETGVVGVGEQFVDPADAQRPWATTPSRPEAQTSCLQQQRNVGQAVEPGRIGLIGPLDHRPTLGVDRHGADLAALGQRFADIQIADRRQAAGAADFDLAFDAAFDLLGDLDATGGRSGRHDALQQNAVRRFLPDGLLDGEQLRAGFRYQATGDPVVLLVACPP
ncbi:MAG TPA: hypothetical protein VNV37_09695 [Solirubrobacteraceae bacterium]|nr:hypothetical protein [Solirubrobacteraceae bacterium]